MEVAIESSSACGGGKDVMVKAEFVVSASVVTVTVVDVISGKIKEMRKKMR